MITYIEAHACSHAQKYFLNVQNVGVATGLPHPSHAQKYFNVCMAQTLIRVTQLQHLKSTNLASEKNTF
jgi:hypothetical protein